MYKKFIIISLIFMLSISIIPNRVMAANESKYIDDSKLFQGVIGINYPNKTGKLVRLQISKNQNTVSYFLLNDIEYFPLQLGNGEYNIRILENVNQNKYKLINEENINLNIKDNYQIYLNSVQNVNWNNSMKSIQKAQELIKGTKNDKEKVTKIYEYIISQINYDNEKAKNVQNPYIPSIDNTYSTKKGICYDYASLFAAMLRSVNIPTKLVTGTSDYVKEYHAWNEVYLNNKWIVIDTTVDSGLKKSKKNFDMIKDSKKYKPSYQY